MSAWTARARRLVMAVAPPAWRLPSEFHLQRRVGKLDPILAMIDLTKRLRGRAIDAGANSGAYTYAFSRVFDRVEAFEPQPWCAVTVADYARAHESVRVHRLGLSNRAYHGALHVPIVRGRWRSHLATGLGSLRPHATLRSRQVPIDLVPLDAFDFDDVAVLKIDVEGHEREVLAGAWRTIERCKPTLIVEIEQRHLAGSATVGEVFTSLAGAGYRGWFLRNGVVTPIDGFQVERDQLPFASTIANGESATEYVNNFVFEPVDGSLPGFFRTPGEASVL